MSTTTMLPLTLNSPLQQNYTVKIAIGDNIFSPPANNGGFWVVVVDRYSLKVVINTVQTANDQAPDLGSYDTDQYMLLFVGLSMRTDRLPQGALYAFLIDNGAGAQLNRLEEIERVYGCGVFGAAAYILVGILGPGQPSTKGIEGAAIDYAFPTGVVLTLGLLGTQVGSQTIYTPVLLA